MITSTDKFTLFGVIFTAFGSSLGMFGILLQTNGYYAFQWFQLFEHLFRVIRSFLTHGPVAARNQIQATVSIAERKGETGVSL